jgi:alpha-methylacyl-CoA racemase
VSGPLDGLRIVELAGIGPGPFAAMLLSDMGADVVRVDRMSAVPPSDAPDAARRASADLLNRGRRSIAVDLKQPEGAEIVLSLAAKADAIIEPFRPGVAERLGVGPDACMARNRRLVYGRMTGWGQDGPHAPRAGHDINYIALAGALDPVGVAGGPPVPPLNLVGDFGGGGMLLAFGIVCALLEARDSGHGQVVDAAMVDGSALLTTLFHGMLAQGRWREKRGANLVDGGAPFYGVYETADGRHVSVGAIEPHFYAELLRVAGLDGDDLPPQRDEESWPAMKERLAAVFRSRTRDQWCEAFEGTDACFAPVLTFSEARDDPHNRHRETFVEVAGIPQPAPAPRFSKTPGAILRPPPVPGEHTDDVLADWLRAEDASRDAWRDARAIA